LGCDELVLELELELELDLESEWESEWEGEFEGEEARRRGVEESWRRGVWS
jgi:hypothetical protein